MNTLTATKRGKTEKLNVVRNNGMIPAVVYGVQVENTPISVSSVDFEKILKIAGESSTIILEITEDKKISQKIDVLIHEVQVDPVKSFPIHVDFLAIDVNKPVEVTIPLEFVGVAPAEKNSLGVLVKTLHEIEIEGLPKNLPQSIKADLSTLNNLDDQIHAKDVDLPDDITLITKEGEVVALIAPIREEPVEEEPADLTEIEVEKKGKQEEGEEETKEEEPKEKGD